MFFAVLALGAATILSLTHDSMSTSFDSKDEEKDHQAISLHDTTALEIAAVELLRSVLEENKPLKQGVLIYSIMCLMVTEVWFLPLSTYVDH